MATPTLPSKGAFISMVTVSVSLAGPACRPILDCTSRPGDENMVKAPGAHQDRITAKIVPTATTRKGKLELHLGILFCFDPAMASIQALPEGP
mmetsp:Transcript_37376/g.87709  ORF Transcript_37376/g.87709 Transcript_37376/m.87709 type:complete len:93 (-) Transcript_37376:3-281(-)